MAGFASQSALRSKWGDIVESGTSNLPEPTEVTKGLKNVVGWLKQVHEFKFYLHFYWCCFHRAPALSDSL